MNRRPLTDTFVSLQARIKTARRRVVMASLYLGTGQLEQELVRTVACVCLRERDPLLEQLFVPF